MTERSPTPTTGRPAGAGPGLDADPEPPGVEVSDGSLRALYDAHAGVLLTYLMRLTKGDRHRAEDFLQETLIRAWRHPEARRPNGEWSRPWLFMVARRIVIDHVRAVQARPPEVGDERLEQHAEVDRTIDGLADRAEVRAAVLALPDRLRSVLVEVYFRDQSVATAAAALGIPEGTIKSRTFHALRALREELVERGFLPPATSGLNAER